MTLSSNVNDLAGRIATEFNTVRSEVSIVDGKTLPIGGVAGQLLVKDSATDYDASWTSDATLNSIRFSLTPSTVPVGSGVLSWNAVDKTLDLQSDGITYQLGQELAQNVQRFNASGLTNGKVVYITGSSGANILVDYALATSDSTSANTFAVMTADAAGGAKAPATTFGLVRGLDTTALTEGATVWLSSTVPGGMTTTKPVAPIHTVQIGVCVRSHATEGVIFVSVQNGYEINELHDVFINTPVDADVLTYDAATGLWKNTPAGTAVAIVSETAPTGVEEGAFWLDSTTLTLYTFYGTAWIEAAPAGPPGPTANIDEFVAIQIIGAY